MGKMRPEILGAAVLFFIVGCAREEIGDARFATGECRRVALIDADTGASIVGAEDFAYDAVGKRLFFSSYDRRAAEKAAKRRQTAIPNGGVYSAALSDIFSADASSISVKPLAAPGDVAGGLRPHGISYDARKDELVFINRTYQRLNNKWEMLPRLQRIRADGEMFVGAFDDAPCAANDVLVTTQQTFMSFDHGRCDWRAGIEDILKLKRSGLALGRDRRVYDRAGFANGLAQTADGMIAMAATRENAILLLKERSGAVEEFMRIDLPGGPDNLSIASDGDIVAAVHPSLWRLGLNRKMGVGKAPSRIVKVNSASGGVELLFDDPTGRLFSAATIAVETPYGLVAGSVTDEGVLVCREAV